MALERVLEPEVMDTPQEATDYDTMDHSGVNRLFVDDLLSLGPVEGDVLDLGTGTAQIPVCLCQQTEGCRVWAVDLAASMLDLARYNVELASLNERIRLDLIDAKSLRYEDEHFDVVMSNSIVHHIPDPTTCFSEAVRVTRKGGRLFFRDLLRPNTQEELDELVTTYAGHENERQRKLFAESLHAALTTEEVCGLIEPLGFEPDTVQVSSDRHWTWSAVRTQ